MTAKKTLADQILQQVAHEFSAGKDVGADGCTGTDATGNDVSDKKEEAIGDVTDLKALKQMAKTMAQAMKMVDDQTIEIKKQAAVMLEQNARIDAQAGEIEQLKRQMVGH